MNSDRFPEEPAEQVMESRSEQETMEFARSVGERAIPGSVYCLRGQLGAGKTHFVKGFVTAFGISPDEVSSPTFSIIHEYSGTQTIYHFDAYRLEKMEEAVEIGAEEYLHGDGVCIIEWPERIGELIPSHAVQIELRVTGPDSRSIEVRTRSRQNR